MLTEKNKHILHLIYGILVSIFTVIAAIFIMTSCIAIYQADAYSREVVAEYFSNIAIWVYLCLAFVLGGFILNLLIPFPQKKKSKRQTAMLLTRLYEKIDWNQCDPQLVQTIKKEQKSRLIHSIITLALFALGATIFLIYACNGANFHQSEINQSMIKAVLFMSACLFLPLIYAIFATYHAKASFEREFSVAKQIKTTKVSQSTNAVPENASNKKLIIQCVLVVIALTLLLVGLFTGGVADVITKAINICTECIGLG